MNNTRKNVIRATRFVRRVKSREADVHVPLLARPGPPALTDVETNALMAAAEAAVAAEASHPVVFDEHPHFTTRESPDGRAD